MKSPVPSATDLEAIASLVAVATLDAERAGERSRAAALRHEWHGLLDKLRLAEKRAKGDGEPAEVVHGGGD